MVPQAELNRVRDSPGPPALFEYAYYALMFYAYFGLAWGLVVPSVGGAMLVVLAAACLISLRTRVLEVCAPIGFALCCGISVIAVQLALHGSDPLDEVRPFITWLMALVIVRALSLREGFLHRFALAAFGMGLCALPFVEWHYSDNISRAAAEGTVLANPNNLAHWFGFCFVYFLVFGIETRRIVARVVSWSMAVGCLYVVGITVSRGALLGVAVASIVAFSRTLKHRFLPLLLFVVFSWIVYESGVFDQVTNFYLTRGMEETGRGFVGPRAFQRFLNSPWEGVGLAQIRTWVGGVTPIPPHNGFLYIALASGVIPVAFFLAYLVRAASGAIQADLQRFPDAQFIRPLVAFAFVVIMISDTAFMVPWTIVVLSYAVSGSGPPRGRRIAVSRMGRTGTGEIRNRAAS
jgi:hypothetical protein